MQLFRYWAHADAPAKDVTGKPLALKRWCGSNASAEEAFTAAQKAVSELARRVSEITISKAERYSYGVRPLPEELIGEPGPSHGVTRNRYGCLVLNATNAMFVDIDLPKRGWILRMVLGDEEKQRLDTLKTWVNAHSGSGVRIYRTAAGLRYLFTHETLAVSNDTLKWQEELNADKLYIKLCKAQNCYRARLTPKPWRIKVERPPNHFPRETAAQQQAFDRWLSGYEKSSKAFATCRFIESLGSKMVHSDLSDIVREHDEVTRATRDLPLA